MKKILALAITIAILIPALSQGAHEYSFVGPGMHYGTKDAYKKAQTAYGRHLRTYASSLYAGCKTDAEYDRRTREWTMAAYGFTPEALSITDNIRISTKGMSHPFIYHISRTTDDGDLVYIGVSLLIESCGTDGIRITALSDDPDEELELKDETPGDVSYSEDGDLMIAGGFCRQSVKGKSGVSMVLKGMNTYNRRMWCGGGCYCVCVNSDRINSLYPSGETTHCVSILYYEEGSVVRDWYVNILGPWDVDVPFYDVSDPKCPYEGGCMGKNMEGRPNKWQNQTQSKMFATKRTIKKINNYHKVMHY